MSKVKISKTYGIHTIELYLKNLKYTEVQKVIERLMDSGEIYETKSDYYNIDRHLKCTYFVEDGIRLRIYQSHNHSNGIGFVINPSTLLSGKYQPVKLWIPTPEAVDELQKRLSIVFDMLGLDSVHSTDLSLCQMDVTLNEWGDSSYDPVTKIRQFRKGIIPKGFEVIPNKDKKLNPYLFMVKSKRKNSKKSSSVIVKAYDKVHELKTNHRYPKKLKDENILRFEVSMKREAFLKKLGLNRDASLYEMLRSGYDQGEALIADYQGKMYPFTGEIVSYEKAKKTIQEKVKDDLLQGQILYLLKKTSDSAGLSTATRKLKEHYTHVDDRRIKKIFAEFDKLGISPITLPKE